MASLQELLASSDSSTIDNEDNKINSLTSFFAGIGSGLIDIPRGLFSLGAAAIDLGADSNLAAKVENAFDQIDPFDELAEATAAGRFSKLLSNLIVPGAAGFKVGSSLAKSAIGAKKSGTFFSAAEAAADPALRKAASLGQRALVGLGGAAGSGAADAIFTAETNIDNFRPLFTDPLDIDYSGRDSAAQQLVRRVQFGTEGAVFAGLVGGGLYGIKALRGRTNTLKSDNEKINKFLAGFRARNTLPEDVFAETRVAKGRRGVDTNKAMEPIRGLDKEIDAIFPLMKRAFDRSGTAAARKDLLKTIDDVLVSGKPEVIENSFFNVTKDGKVLPFTTRKEAQDYLKELGEPIKGRIKQTKFAKVDFGKIKLTGETSTETKTMLESFAKLGVPADRITKIVEQLDSIRGQWGDMFSVLGGKMSSGQIKTFKELFANKFQNYLRGTYEIFENKPLMGMWGYKPAEESIDKLANLFMKYDPKMSREGAEYEVSKLVQGASRVTNPKLQEGRTLGTVVPLPATALGSKVKGIAGLIEPDLLTYIKSNDKVGVEFLTKEARTAIDEVLGRIDDPFLTMLQGTNRLSVVTRRNELMDNLVSLNLKNADMDKGDALKGIAAKTGMNKGQFLFKAADSSDPIALDVAKREAAAKFGHENVRRINMDPSQRLDFGGRKNPLNGQFTDASLAEAFEEAGGVIAAQRWYETAYNNFILYPKATSQVAKTILSPITHVRNIVSAGAFATANGLIPGLTVNPREFASVMKDAYKTLDVAGPGTRQNLKRYRELLELGVVNTQVQIGDLSRLLRDTNFGETLTTSTGIGPFFKKLGKFKKWSQDMYTAEDDIWKITSFGLERNRIQRALEKHGVGLGKEMTDSAGNVIKVTEEYLDQRAADIVKNNIPNYDYVGSFIKDLRRLPVGNFVSFPAEIIRTSTNILSSGAREVGEQFTRADGQIIKPFKSIGYKRLVGFGTTVGVVPYATQEAFKTIYDVTEDEMQALKRYVPEWSKNSVLLPIKTKEGKMKYVDFSHANAYDTMIRPFTTMLNAAASGAGDDARMSEELLKGVFEATKELGSPFISEAIWTQAATDIIVRGGRTKEGRRLYTEQTSTGDKAQIILKHIVATQAPFNIKQFQRLGLAINEKTDKYGQRFELSDEVAGFVGLRAVEIDPIRAMKYKIADFTSGINNSRREFTSPLLKGGSITPEMIVDRYDTANRAMYKVQQEMFKDYYAALRLGASPNAIRREFKDRVSNKSLNAIRRGVYIPFKPSKNIEKTFRENAAEIGENNPYAVAKPSVLARYRMYNRVPLLMEDLPFLDNPFVGLGEGITDALPTTELLGPGVTNPLTNPTLTGGVNNTQNTMIKGQQVFGSNDPIFGR